MLTKSEIRSTIKSLGYKCSIRKHGLILDAVVVHVPELGIGAGNVFGGSVYNDNKKCFEYVKSLRGTILDTGEKVV